MHIDAMFILKKKKIENAVILENLLISLCSVMILKMNQIYIYIYLMV